MNRALRFLVTTALVACVLPGSPGHAQQPDDVLYLDHADSLIGREIEGEKVRELVGNVRFSQGSILVNCQRAMQYMSRNKVELEGEVAVRDDSLTLFTNRGVYYSDTKSAEAFDMVRLNDGITFITAGYGLYNTESRKAYFRYRVRVEDTASVLLADELTYFRDEQHLVADGNVVLLNPANSVTIRGGHFDHEKTAGTSVMTMSPRAVQVDTSDDGTIDSLVVTGGRLESYQDSTRRLVAIDSVVMIRSDFSGMCGRAVFLSDQDSIELRSHPFVWYATEARETTQVSGDSMFVHLNERTLERLFVRGSATAISQADSSDATRFHQMTGVEMLLTFRDRKIRRIDVEKTASMVYYLYEDGKPNGLNTTSGDRVAMLFDDRRIASITVAGGVEGRYIPERLLKNREPEYNLQGFNWKVDRPRRTE